MDEKRKCPCCGLDYFLDENGRAQRSDLDEALEIIVGLKRRTCWCEMAIGNPMVKTHSDDCNRARAFLGKHAKRSEGK